MTRLIEPTKLDCLDDIASIASHGGMSWLITLCHQLLLSGDRPSSQPWGFRKVTGLPHLTQAKIGDIRALVDTDRVAWIWRELANDIDLHPIRGLPPVVAIATGARCLLILDKLETVWEVRLETPTATIVLKRLLEGISSIAADLFTYNAITQDGQVYSWHHYPGRMDDQPKIMTDLPPIHQVALSAETAIYVAKSGDLWGLGSSTCGQLGLSDTKGNLRLEVIERPERLPLSELIRRPGRIKSAKPIVP
jgi:alpha-tubulin suppressor-like RCC1 family protein